MSERYESLRHRSTFDLHPLDEDGDAFLSAADVVVDWIVQKERRYGSSPVADDLGEGEAFPRAWEYSAPDHYRGGDFDEDRWPALASEAEHDDEGRVTRWILEYDEPDANHDDRRWHTVVCLQRVEGSEGTERGVCRISVQSACRLLGRKGELPETIATPSLVRTLIALPGFEARVGTIALQTAPVKLDAESFERFAADLVDQKRKLPLVLFCTGYDGKIPEQAKQLARRSLGTANVYVLDWSNEGLRDGVQKLFERGTSAGEYACPKNSCRMYLPHLDLSNPNRSMSHKSWNRGEMQAVLPSKFAESLARRFLPSMPVPTIADPHPEVAFAEALAHAKKMARIHGEPVEVDFDGGVHGRNAERDDRHGGRDRARGGQRGDDRGHRGGRDDREHRDDRRGEHRDGPHGDRDRNPRGDGQRNGRRDDSSAWYGRYAKHHGGPRG